MNEINRIKIGGFRKLKDIDLPVRPFMVLIGANGVGKTSLLDAFSLLSASAAGELNKKLSELGGVANILTRGKTESVSLLVDMNVPIYLPIEYDLSFTPKGVGYAISQEVLSQPRHGFTGSFKHIESRDGEIKYFEIENGRLVRPTWEHNPLETSLFQVPKMFREPEELRRILGSITQYHALNVGPRAPVKLPQ